MLCSPNGRPPQVGPRWQGIGHDNPTHILDGIGQFLRHLVVGHVALTLLPVEGEIVHADKHSEHVIAAADVAQVVAELSGVHLGPSVGKHLDDVLLQAVEVHLDIGGDGLEGTGAGLVTVVAVVSAKINKIRKMRNFLREKLYLCRRIWKKG